MVVINTFCRISKIRPAASVELSVSTTIEKRDFDRRTERATDSYDYYCCRIEKLQAT